MFHKATANKATVLIALTARYLWMCRLHAIVVSFTIGSVQIMSKPNIRIIVAGGRDFNDKAKLYNSLDTIVAKYTDTNTIEIVTGGARGADYLGKRYALDKHLLHTELPAQWDKYGKSAGYRRNAQMADYVTDDGVLVAFWDGRSKGTSHMIDVARRKGIKVFVFTYGDDVI